VLAAPHRPQSRQYHLHVGPGRHAHGAPAALAIKFGNDFKHLVRRALLVDATGWSSLDDTATAEVMCLVFARLPTGPVGQARAAGAPTGARLSIA